MLVESMHHIILTSIRFVVQGVNFFSMIANEVTILECQLYNVHVYVKKDWSHTPMYMFMWRKIGVTHQCYWGLGMCGGR
jgi:hypothetical protein